MTEIGAPQNEAPQRLSFPPLNFRAARQRLRIALAAAVVVPIGLLVLYAFYTYHRAVAEESAMLNRLAWIAEGKLNNLLDVNKELVVQAESEVGETSSFNKTEEQRLHVALQKLVSSHPQVAAISIVDQTGKLVVSSRRFPAPNISIGDRDDFKATSASYAQMHISLPQRSRVQGAEIVNSLTARLSPDGLFLGAIVISLSRESLLQFYQTLNAENPAVTVGLYRDDGGILVRFPPRLLENAPATHRPLAEAFAQKADGIMTIDSPLDGKQKLLAYRRVAHYPLYVSAGLSLADLARSWLREDMVIVLAALIPCFCLWALIIFSLRRLRAEEDSWLSWRRELRRRRTAEVAARKLQRMGALGNLVASVAHDFNNLLMVVTANMEIVRRKNYNGVQNEIDAVERASVSARALARRLMSVARRAPLQIQTVQLETWLPETEPLIMSAISSKVLLHLEVIDSTWPIAVDPSELTSALVNIAINAKDAMPQGGTFRVTCSNITLPTSRHGLMPGDYVEFACKDTGSGMTSEVARQAFEPLFTTKQAGAGTGLGLAQVAAMSEQAGGKARVETHVGNGTTIYFYLPRWTGTVNDKVSANVAASADPDNARSTILLVEDNDEVAAGLLAVLDVLGWNARHAPTGDAALKVLEEGYTFGLVLSDIQMPGRYDGIDLVEWIKHERPNQAVTLMTGYAEHLEKARQLGVPVLSKPFNAEDLSILLNRVHSTPRAI